MNGFFGELGRRNVVRMGALYAVGGWLTLQVLGMLILGFPVVLVFAWVYEMTPEGLKRESQVDRSASVTPYTAKKLNGAIITVLTVALVPGLRVAVWPSPAGPWSKDCGRKTVS